MGMTSDQNENISFAEQLENAKREAKLAEQNKARKLYVFVSIFNINGKEYQLLAGEDDHKWYKSEYLYSHRFDEMNRTPLVKVYSDEITPVTEEEFYSYFPRPNEKKKTKSKK